MFEVGKRVICIKTHSCGVTQKGKVYEVIGIHKRKCGCIDLNLNIASITKISICTTHNDIMPSNGIYWQGAIRFVPYDDSKSEHTIESLLKEIEEKQLIES